MLSRKRRSHGGKGHDQVGKPTKTAEEKKKEGKKK